MKRAGFLIEQIATVENVAKADVKARKGKEFRSQVKSFDKHREENISRIAHLLKHVEKYHTSKYRIFEIHEKKTRIIYDLPYDHDRVAHHAIMNVLEPHFNKLFISSSYSCIKKRGIHKCSHDVQKAMKRDKAGTKYYLKIDIKKFYPSVNHKILFEMLDKVFKDQNLLTLLKEIVNSADGLPIGNYISQFLANFYLTFFDHWVKEVLRVKHYFRYADDIVILAESKEKLQQILVKIKRYLFKKLKLKVKGNSIVAPVDKQPIDFVGFVVTHGYTLIRKCIKQSLFRKIKILNDKYNKEGPEAIPAFEYKQQICSWWGWFKYSNSRNLEKKIKNIIPYDIDFERKNKNRVRLGQRTATIAA